MREIFLLLGSNRGDRHALLEEACRMIEAHAGVIVKASGRFETEPWGFTDDTPFINQALEIESELAPEALMEQLLAIEARLGRVRPPEVVGCTLQEEVEGYVSRTMDIDILFYGSKVIFTGTLMIPHPRLHVRRFVLEPLAEIAPGFVHPVFQKTVTELLDQLTGTLS
jgi:2-amino-4-hydroxy-6-hydroxymethyldihydropteridine diphosphokinase